MRIDLEHFVGLHATYDVLEEYRLMKRKAAAFDWAMSNYVFVAGEGNKYSVFAVTGTEDWSRIAQGYTQLEAVEAAMKREKEE